MGFIVGGILGVVVLALIIFPGFRKSLKVLCNGFLGIFVEDIAKTPEGADAVYQQAIDEMQKRYENAHDTAARFTGEYNEVQTKINKLMAEQKNCEMKCQGFVDRGDIESARIYSEKRSEIIVEIQTQQEYLLEIEPYMKEAQATHLAYEKKLAELKKERKKIVEQLKLHNNMNELLNDMDELRRDTATDKLLGAARDGAKDLRKEVVGKTAIHASKASTRAQIADRKAAAFQSDDYLNSLIAKKQGTSALPAGGRTIPMPKQTTDNKTKLPYDRK